MTVEEATRSINSGYLDLSIAKTFAAERHTPREFQSYIHAVRNSNVERWPDACAIVEIALNIAIAEEHAKSAQIVNQNTERLVDQTKALTESSIRAEKMGKWVVGLTWGLLILTLILLIIELKH